MFHVKHDDYKVAKDVLLEGLDKLNLPVAEDKIISLLDYFDLLLYKNESLNLISSKQSLKDQVVIHLIDSLTPLLWDNWPDDCKALDIGSGGGLPAIPLSIVFNGWNYSLAESTGKKANFLNELIQALSLSNVKVINSFLEPGYNKEKSEYELVSARGVADLKKLAAIIGPRLLKGGVFISFKGPKGAEEYKEAKSELSKRKLVLVDQLDFKLPFVEAGRILFLFEKR